MTGTEILVDVVDVVLTGSGIDEKFLGLSLFALVPNTTEFMNAMSFAMNGNIALRYVLVPIFRRATQSVQYGNRLGIRAAGLPFTDPRHGGVLCVL